MSIAKKQARLERLKKGQQSANNLDFTAWRRGEITEEEMEQRCFERQCDIEELEAQVCEAEDDEAAEARREQLERRRTRWHGFSYAAMRHFPYFRGRPLTEAQKAVLCALGRASKGKMTVAVAHDWICAKTGVSRGTVKNAIRRFEDMGIVNRRERRLKGKAMSLWNLYTFKTADLRKWVADFFTIKGARSSPHPLTGDSSCSTEEEKPAELDLKDERAKACRQKAERYVEREAESDMPAEDFALLATGAMRELGHVLQSPNSPEGVAEAVEALKQELQPDFKDWFWSKGLRRHGRYRALLAFLETRLIRDMRRSPVPDGRPWNEREPVRCANRYLWGILKKSARECCPEITVAAKLIAAEVYEVPAEIRSAVKRRGYMRKGFHRHMSSA